MRELPGLAAKRCQLALHRFEPRLLDHGPPLRRRARSSAPRQPGGRAAPARPPRGSGSPRAGPARSSRPRVPAPNCPSTAKASSQRERRSRSLRPPAGPRARCRSARSHSTASWVKSSSWRAYTRVELIARLVAGEVLEVLAVVLLEEALGASAVGVHVHGPAILGSAMEAPTPTRPQRGAELELSIDGLAFGGRVSRGSTASSCSSPARCPETACGPSSGRASAASPRPGRSRCSSPRPTASPRPPTTRARPGRSCATTASLRSSTGRWTTPCAAWAASTDSCSTRSSPPSSPGATATSSSTRSGPRRTARWSAASTPPGRDASTRWTTACWPPSRGTRRASACRLVPRAGLTRVRQADRRRAAAQPGGARGAADRPAAGAPRHLRGRARRRRPRSGRRRGRCLLDAHPGAGGDHGGRGDRAPRGRPRPRRGAVRAAASDLARTRSSRPTRRWASACTASRASWPA